MWGSQVGVEDSRRCSCRDHLRNFIVEAVQRLQAWRRVGLHSAEKEKEGGECNLVNVIDNNDFSFVELSAH